MSSGEAAPVAGHAAHAPSAPDAGPTPRGVRARSGTAPCSRTSGHVASVPLGHGVIRVRSTGTPSRGEERDVERDQRVRHREATASSRRGSTKSIPSYGASDRTSRSPCARCAGVDATSTRRHRDPTATRASSNSANGAAAGLRRREAQATDAALVRRGCARATTTIPTSASTATTAAAAMRTRVGTRLLRELGLGRAAVQAERVGHAIGHVVRLRARRVRAARARRRRTARSTRSRPSRARRTRARTSARGGRARRSRAGRATRAPARRSAGPRRCRSSGRSPDSVITRATASGTHSSTIAKQPASASAHASSASALAASSSLPCTLKPPSAWIDCGVRPMWPITGISASRIACTASSRLRPPSSFTAPAPRADRAGPRCARSRRCSRGS